MHEKLVKIFDDVTADQDRTSVEVDISQIYGFSVHANHVGTAAGNLIIQVSVNGTDFIDVDTNAITGTGDYIENFPDQMYKKVRVFFDFTSGTSTLNAWMHLKG